MAHGLLSLTVLLFKVLLPQACGRLDIMNSNLPPSSIWLCEMIGLSISALLMVSEFTNGLDGAPSAMIFRLVALDNGNWISTSSKNGLKFPRLGLEFETTHTYDPTTYNPDTGFTG